MIPPRVRQVRQGSAAISVRLRRIGCMTTLRIQHRQRRQASAAPTVPLQSGQECGSGGWATRTSRVPQQGHCWRITLTPGGGAGRRLAARLAVLSGFGVPHPVGFPLFCTG